MQFSIRCVPGAEPSRYRGGFRRMAEVRCNGLAAVELAICLPVLVLLVLGSIELTNFIFLKHALTSAAYEGVREAVRREGTDASSMAMAQQVLTARGIQGASVRVTPGTQITSGQPLTVEVSAPSSSNRVVIPRFVQGLTARATATMIKD